MKNENMESYIAQKAIEEYYRIMNRNKLIEECLKNKKFPLNTIVIKTDQTYFDKVFAIDGYPVGKIVGYDFENDYYRVYFSDDSPFVGVHEERLNNYEGDVPSDIKNYTPLKIRSLFVKL